ncbi:MAG: hypothetical protein ACRCTD_14460 [Beijerinckiaceae bacterium]
MEAPPLSGAFSSTSQTPVRLPVQSAAPVVKTELPAQKAVNAVGEEPAVRVNISDDGHKIAAAQQMMKRIIEKHITYDNELRTLIVKSVDQTTGKTVSQLPDEMSMQLRVYMRGVIEKLDRSNAETHARIEAIA